MKTITLTHVKENPRLLTQLSYPSGERDYAKEILKELEEMDVKSLYIEGDVLKSIGKGYRSIVILVHLNCRRVVAKILRTDAGISSLEHEATMTMEVNKHGIGPRLYDWRPHVILLEYIEGEDLDEWIEECRERDSLAKVLAECLTKARILDAIGVDHGELHDARKHIILERTGKARIIDFGKASRMRKPKNVTSLFSYITHGPRSKRILELLGVEKPPIEYARRYKERMDDESFNKLLEMLNLR